MQIHRKHRFGQYIWKDDEVADKSSTRDYIGRANAPKRFFIQGNKKLISYLRTLIPTECISFLIYRIQSIFSREPSRK